MENEARDPRGVRRVVLPLAGLAVALGLALGCRSLPKEELAERLAAIDKNAPLGPLSRTEIAFDPDGRGAARPFELIYVHVPAREPAPGRLPVVLVHGTPSTLYSWVELMLGTEAFPGLAAERDVYAIEVVGHGIAPGDASPYSFERCARFVAAALRGLGLERVHLVGQSYGGEFAWRAALNEPDLVAGLVVEDSSGYPRADGDWLPEEVEMRENGLAKIGWVLNSRERIESALEPHYEEIPPGRVEEFFLVCENSHNWKAMIDLVRDEEGTRSAELTELRAPTLVLWGEDDVAYPLERYGRRFAEDVPDARLAVVPGTGHYPHEARPAEVARLLREFFDGVEARP